MLKIVVDVEATCCENDTFPRNEMEIIEIGAVCVDSSGKVVSKYQDFIRPVKNPILTDFCKLLTTIKQSDVDSRYTFLEAGQQFLGWVNSVTGNNDFVFYSWGDFDKNILRRQFAEYDIDAEFFLKNHRNAKQLFAQHKKCKPMGVSPALRYKGMKFEGTPHRGLDDAINISRLISTFL